jgi:hypothetical protein
MSETYHSLHWLSDEARLRSYSANLSSRVARDVRRDVAIVTVVIEITDTYRLGTLLDALRGIKQAQEQAESPKQKRPSAKTPLLLTYDDGGQS